MDAKTKKRHDQFSKYIPIIAVLTLAACGGGGGSTSNSSYANTPDATPEPTTLSEEAITSGLALDQKQVGTFTTMLGFSPVEAYEGEVVGLNDNGVNLLVNYIDGASGVNCRVPSISVDGFGGYCEVGSDIETLDTIQTALEALAVEPIIAEVVTDFIAVEGDSATVVIEAQNATSLNCGDLQANVLGTNQESGNTTFEISVPANVAGDVVLDCAIVFGEVQREFTAPVAFTVAENRPPVFDTESMLAFDENSDQLVATLIAVDPDGRAVSFEITGGSDRSAFTLSDEGELAFVRVPDYEAPHDENEDNQFDISVTAFDTNGGTVVKDFSILIGDKSQLDAVVTFPTEGSNIGVGTEEIAVAGYFVDLEDGQISQDDINAVTVMAGDSELVVMQDTLKWRGIANVDIEDSMIQVDVFRDNEIESSTNVSINRKIHGVTSSTFNSELGIVYLATGSTVVAYKLEDNSIEKLFDIYESGLDIPQRDAYQLQFDSTENRLFMLSYDTATLVSYSFSNGEVDLLYNRNDIEPTFLGGSAIVDFQGGKVYAVDTNSIDVIDISNGSFIDSFLLDTNFLPLSIDDNGQLILIQRDVSPQSPFMPAGTTWAYNSDTRELSELVALSFDASTFINQAIVDDVTNSVWISSVGEFGVSIGRYGLTDGAQLHSYRIPTEYTKDESYNRAVFFTQPISPTKGLIFGEDYFGVSQIDLESDSIEVFSDSGVGYGERLGSLRAIINGITFSSLNNTLYLLDSVDEQIIEIDISAGGNRTQLFDGVITNIPFLDIPDVGIDVNIDFSEFENRIYYKTFFDSIYSYYDIEAQQAGTVDGLDISSDVLSDGFVLDTMGGVYFGEGRDIYYFSFEENRKELLFTSDDELSATATASVLDEENEVLFYYDFGVVAIFKLDLSNGRREVIGSEDIGVGPLATNIGFGGMVFNPLTQEIYVSVKDTIIAVDTETLERRYLGADGVGQGVSLPFAASIELDVINQRLFLFDQAAGVLYGFDVATGDRIVISQ